MPFKSATEDGSSHIIVLRTKPEPSVINLNGFIYFIYLIYFITLVSYFFVFYNKKI
jgi:hypothetical protein